MCEEQHSLTISCDEFLNYVRELSEAFGDALGEAGLGELMVSVPNLESCYVRAVASVPLFNSDDGINYYREAGLLCYWIAKLKPFFVYGDATEEASQLVNEYMALLLASGMINVAHEEILQDERFSDITDSCRDLQQINSRNFDAMLGRLANSLRFQVKAAGALPTLLEALFFLPVDDFAAWDA